MEREEILEKIKEITADRLGVEEARRGPRVFFSPRP